MKKAIIVSSAEELQIRQILKNEGFKILSLSSGNETRRMTATDSEYDIIIICSPLPDEFGQELAENIAANTSSGVIFICGNGVFEEMSDKLTYFGVTVLSKPANRQVISNAIKLVYENKMRLTGAKKENDSLFVKIDEMRLINRAKSILMKYLRFTEPQAHKYIEKQAMNTRHTRKEVALHIIETYEK
ncbi:MAG: response regulator [Ruminococcus sp.]|nr:response regulator [Ruminococcus sp.]